MIRWILSDPVALDSWTFPQNPREMSSPTLAEHTTMAPSTAGVVRSMRAGRAPASWSFSGSVRRQSDYDTLLSWKNRDLIHITDHRGRVLKVIPVSFEPVPKRITDVPWGFTYKFTGLYLGRVA